MPEIQPITVDYNPFEVQGPSSSAPAPVSNIPRISSTKQSTIEPIVVDYDPFALASSHGPSGSKLPSMAGSELKPSHETSILEEFQPYYYTDNGKDYDNFIATMPQSVQDKANRAIGISAALDVKPQHAFDLEAAFTEMHKNDPMIQKLGRAVKAGFGQTYSAMGSYLKSKGMEGKNLDDFIEYGERLQRANMNVLPRKEFEWSDVLNFEYLATNLAEMTPIWGTLAVSAIVANYVAAPIAGALQLGRFGKGVLMAIGGSTLATPMESAFEAGSAYQDAIKRGESHDDARLSADNVFSRNMALLGLTNFASLGMAFVPLNLFGKAADTVMKKRIASVLVPGARIIGVAGSEGGQERYQEIIQMEAAGEEADFFDLDNARLNEATALGAIFGLGMGGVGSVWNALTTEATKELPGPLKKVYEEEKKYAEASGLTEQQAELKALDAVVETEEGRQHIEEVINRIKEKIENPDFTPEIQEDVQEEDQEAPIPEFDEQAFDEKFDALVQSGQEPTDEELDDLIYDYSDAPKDATQTPEFRAWFGGSKVVDDQKKPLATYHWTDKEFESFNTETPNDIGAYFGTKAQADYRRKFISDKKPWYRPGTTGASKIIEAYLSIQNPLRLPDLDGWSFFGSGLTSELIKKNIVSKSQVNIKIGWYKKERIKLIEKYKKPEFAMLPESWKKFNSSADEISYKNADDKLENILTKWLKSKIIEKGYDGVVYENRLDGGGGDSYIAFHPYQIKSISNRGTFDPNDPRIDYNAGKTKKQGPITADQARSLFAPFAEVVSKSGHKIEFHNSLDEMPDSIEKRKFQEDEQQTGRRIMAAYVQNTDTSHIFTDGAESMNDVLREVLHESIGHAGLYKFMGEELNPFLDYVLAHPKYGEQVKKVAKERGIDFIKIETRRQAAKEWFAGIAEREEIQPTLMTRLIVAFKNALRRMGIKAEMLTGFSDSDIAEIIRGSRAAISGRNVRSASFGKGVVDYSDAPKKPEESKSAKTRIRAITGQTRTSPPTQEHIALREVMRAAQKAASAAYRAGNKEAYEKVKTEVKEHKRTQKEKEKEAQAKRTAIKNIQKMQKKMGGKIAVDYQKRINALLSGLDFKKPTAAKLKELEGLKNYLETEGIPLGIKQKHLNELGRLSKVPIRDFKAKDAVALEDTVKRLYELGKVKNELKFKNDERAREKAKKELIADTKNLDPKVKDKANLTKREKAWVNAINLFVFNDHGPRVADLIDGFGKFKKANARLIKWLGGLATKATFDADQAYLDTLEKIKETGIGEITKESAVRMVINMTLRQGGRSQVQTLLEHYKLDEVPALTEIEEKVVAIIKEATNKNKARLAAIFEELNDEIFPEEKVYYGPFKYVDDPVLVPDANVMGGHKTTHTFQGFTYERVEGVQKLLRVDILEVLKEALHEQHWYMELEPALSETKQLVFSKEYHAAGGDIVQAWWRRELDIIARRGWLNTANPGSGTLKGLRHNLNDAILLFKVSTIMLQVGAVFNGMAYANTAWGKKAALDVLVETTKMLINPQYFKEYKATSPGLQTRSGAGELAVEEEMAELGSKTDFAAKVRRFGYGLISAPDLRVAAGSQKAVEKILIKEGVENAKEEAEFYMEMMNSGTNIVYRPHVLATGEAARTFLAFQTYTNNMFMSVLHEHLASGIVHDPSYKKKFAALISIGILMAAGLLEDEAKKIVNGFLRQKEYKDKGHSWLFEAVMNIATAAPFVGPVIGAAVEKTDAAPPLIRVAKKTGEGLYRAFNSKDEDAQWSGLVTASEGAFSLLGVPGTLQIYDIGKGFTQNQ